MRSRRGGLAGALGVTLALALVLAALPWHFSGAAKIVGTTNENHHTITLALPGPFSACPYLSPHATPTSDAIADLTLPSAFLTEAGGTLVGEDGPLATAELTSLSPETVRYTITAGAAWSDGAPFTGHDLVAWAHYADTLASVNSDGYRDIKTLSVSKSGLAVTAVFATPYANWSLLFRDVEAAGSSTSCAVSNLVTRPSLGPYKVASASANRVVLTLNKSWPVDPNRFGRVVITDSLTPPSSASVQYASYQNAVTRAVVEVLSTHPTLSTRIASSSNIEEMTFSPEGPLTRLLEVREALSWSIERQTMIDSLFGAVTYSPSVAASALYSQGQSNYPGSSGTGPSGQTTTTTTPDVATNGLNDCAACAVDILQENGFVRTAKGWVSPDGKLLKVRLAIGPSALDHAVAHLIELDWAAVGIRTTSTGEKSGTQAAQAAASGKADVALFARPTSTDPAYTARSWAGSAYPDTYPSGVRDPTVTKLFDQAMAIFNPVTAASTWSQLDQTIMDEFWVRPLFTPPSLTVASSSITTVAATSSVVGFVDQLPTWTVLPTTSTGT